MQNVHAHASPWQQCLKWCKWRSDCLHEEHAAVVYIIIAFLGLLLLVKRQACTFSWLIEASEVLEAWWSVCVKTNQGVTTGCVWLSPLTLATFPRACNFYKHQELIKCTRDKSDIWSHVLLINSHHIQRKGFMLAVLSLPQVIPLSFWSLPETTSIGQFTSVNPLQVVTHGASAFSDVQKTAGPHVTVAGNKQCHKAFSSVMSPIPSA